MGSLAHISKEEALDLPSGAERRALVERVAGSLHFQRSARLRDFLLYVGRQSVKDGSREIHEQMIGAEVFGRPPNYDTSQDNIVRVNATELRKRIELYFATEGAHEPVVFEIPRGGYRLVFRHRTLAPQSLLHGNNSLPPVAGAPAVSHAPPTRGRPSITWMALCAVLAVVCGLQFQQNRAMRSLVSVWDGKPALAAFWGDFLHNHGQTDVVLADDSFSLTEDLIHHPIELGDYLSRNYMRQIQSSDLSADRKYDLDQIFSHNLVTFGTVKAAQAVLAEVPPPAATHLTLARYYAADAFKRNNVVLVGGRKANPWVHLFDDQINFVTDYNDEHSQAIVRNLHPKPGEQAEYATAYEANALTGYSVVAYLPTPSRNGNAIILAGTDSDATDAAAEFLVSEDQMEGFRNLLHAKTFPYFEILLQTSRLSGTSLNAKILAYRSYPDLH